MATIPALKIQIDADVTDKVAASSISPGDVGDNMTALADEIRDRGIKTVANTGALATLDSADTTLALVTGVGIFKDSATGPANASTIFAGVGGRFWVLTYLISPLRFSINATGTVTLPSGRLLESILARPSGGNINLKIGTTLAGDEISMAADIVDGDDFVVVFPKAARANTTIYFTFTGPAFTTEILLFIKSL